METRSLNRLSPLKLSKNCTLQNRVVIPAMASETANTEGFVTVATLQHYSRLASAGAGLIYAEYTYVHNSGRSEGNQLSASSDLHVEGLSKISKIIKASNAFAGLQLTHAGAKTSRDLTDGRLMGPSNLSVPVKGKTLEAPTPMTKEEIEIWIDSFAQAARRAAEAGFDIVELHSAHGYGLNQWISPLTNKREDEYGGTLLNRLRLLTQIINRIQNENPSMLISVRIPGQDHLEGGLSISEGIQISKYLESIGVNIINVSSGIGGWRRPQDRSGEGYLVPEAVQIQKNLSVPVIGVGGIESKKYIDEIISDGSLMLAAVGRAILKNPQEWASLNML